MTDLRFAFRLARREARTGVRRVGVYMTSIVLGVASLVAIHSFREDVARSVEDQSRNLLGADARLVADRVLPDSLVRVVDSLAAEGAASASVTTALSMVLAPRTDRVRLLQVRGLSGGGWPFYGRVRTSPPDRWGVHPRAGSALVDPAVLTQLGIAVGDSLVVGEVRLRVEGTVEDVPTDLGFQAAVGPRVWISEGDLTAAGLLDFGSLARYETYLRFPLETDAGAVWTRYGSLFRRADVRYTTAGEQARELTDALDFLARYLGLVGLGALLLGGVGVASAVHVYVKEKVTAIAVLRCIGARQRTAFLAYLLQAGLLGLAGAAAGAGLGVLAQQSLPALLGDILPVAVRPRVYPRTIAAGIAVGASVSVLFALGPLLEIRNVPPLRALRHGVEAPRRRLDPWRVVAFLLLAGAVTVLCVLEAPSAEEGLAFAGALALVGALLAGIARALMGATRRWFPARAGYTVRQGVANLFRPSNQTLAVTLALGLGAFVVGTILQVQASLTARLSLDEETGRPNLLLFDIQPDQLEGVLALLPPQARRDASVTPVVPARISAIGREGVDSLRAAPRGERPERWALRREYRHTYRGELTDSEELVAGAWFDEARPRRPGGPARISLEEDLAGDLRVGLGDTITWDVGGRPVQSVVTSLRRVDWERFATNFFVVFEPGVLESAPRMTVVLARVPSGAARAALQRDLVDAYPNVSALDLSRVREVVEAILSRADRAVAALALFTGLAGLLVLVGALATSRHQRVREAALLRTLGARRSQVVAVLLSEYVALAAVASLGGLVLALAGAGLLTTLLFEIPFVPSLPAVVLVWLAVTGATVVVGMAGSRGVLRHPPLPILREVAE